MAEIEHGCGPGFLIFNSVIHNIKQQHQEKNGKILEGFLLLVGQTGNKYWTDTIKSSNIWSEGTPRSD